MRSSGALLRGDGSEDGPALLAFLAASVRAEDLPCGVVDERQDCREELLAIVAEKFVAGHTNLLGQGVAREILELASAEHNMVSRTELLVPLSALGRTITGIGRRLLCPDHRIALCAFSFACSHCWLLSEVC